ncbi:carboxyl transferase domain-containing protein [Kitasatospora sp. NPDC004272]
MPALHDPLGFVDSRPHAERPGRARADTGLHEAVLCAAATVEGQPRVAAVTDFRFLGGSLGCAVGALITHAARTGPERRAPLVLVTASGGARMQEGVLPLMQMAKTARATAEPDGAGIRTVSIVIDPAYDSPPARAIARAPDREQAIARLDRALGEFRIDGPGVRTTSGYLRRTLADPRFRAGRHTTALVAETAAVG